MVLWFAQMVQFVPDVSSQVVALLRVKSNGRNTKHIFTSTLKFPLTDEILF